MTTADERSTLLLQRKKLNESLRRLRADQASKLKISPMQVMQNSTLADIVILLPQSRAELVQIKGLGPSKIAQFGDAILAAVEAYRKDCLRSKEEPERDSSPPMITPDDKGANGHSSVVHVDEDEIGVGPLLGAEFV